MYGHNSNPWKDTPRDSDYYGPESPKSQEPISMKPLWIGLGILICFMVLIGLVATMIAH